MWVWLSTHDKVEVNSWECFVFKYRHIDRFVAIECGVVWFLQKVKIRRRAIHSESHTDAIINSFFFSKDWSTPNVSPIIISNLAALIDISCCVIVHLKQGHDTRTCTIAALNEAPLHTNILNWNAAATSVCCQNSAILQTVVNCIHAILTFKQKAAEIKPCDTLTG